MDDEEAVHGQSDEVPHDEADELLEGMRNIVFITWDPETDALEIEGSEGMSIFEVYGLLVAATAVWKTSVLFPMEEYEDDNDDSEGL